MKFVVVCIKTSVAKTDFSALTEPTHKTCNYSNSVSIAVNLNLKTGSKGIIQKKQRSFVINLRHSRGQHLGERLGKRQKLG